ncbi:MAG: regulatory protein RecX [Candidatus Dormibacteria bacterium]|jgi:regulatory protein|nr:recombination regulator RecX [Chloroflexota bacterium]
MALSRSGGGRGHRPAALAAVDPDDREAAAAMAQRLLAITDRSRVELQRRLERRGYTPSTAAEAVDRLAARGWVDDARLAEDLARRRSSHGYGRRRVLADLVARGVDPETVSRTAAELPASQGEAVRIAAERLRHRRDGPPAPDEVRRLAAALQRRGFDMADIRAELRRLCSEPAGEPDGEG